MYMYILAVRIQYLLVILCLSEFYCYQLKEEYYWDTPNFEFPNNSALDLALSTGSYIPENNVVYAVGAWKDKIFISIFSYFSKNVVTNSPVLFPYPSFDENYVSEDPRSKTVSLPYESSIINSAYFRIDKCDRLWIIDAGVVGYYGERRIVVQPAIVVFDLKTDVLLRRFEIPAEFVHSEAGFTNLDIDYKRNSCNNVYAYVTDLFRSIVVYSWKKDRAWRLLHKFFGPDPHAGNFHYEGVNFQWNYGLLGVTVGERHSDGSRRVYLKPFASTKTYYVSNKILQNEGYINSNRYFYDINLLGDRGKKGHVYEYAYDEKSNVLFDAQFNRKRIGCWNVANPYSNSSFDVVYKSNKRFFAIDINIDINRNVWVVSNNYPLFLYGPWNAKSKNIRIFKAKVDDLISGTVCEQVLAKGEGC